MPVFANILQPLIDFFEVILVFFHDSVGFGWGMAIIAMTIVVRAALLPLTIKQFKSMQNLVKHQPELKKLQDRYKGDRERLNQEMMKFYRENNVNPFASCLPLLAQIPVFISLFYLLQDDLRGKVCPERQVAGAKAVACGNSPASEFLFISDITSKATGGVLVTLLVLYVGSQLLSSILSMQSTTDKTQRYIFMALPFVFVPVIIGFPAGLLVYWITTNLWTVVQQTIIRRRLGPMRPPDADAAAGGLGDLFKRREPSVPVTPDKPKGRTTAAPPPPPRKKKKRSGRRR